MAFRELRARSFCYAGFGIYRKQTMKTTDRFVFFFGKDDFLSNWHPARFTIKSVTFGCVEQFMMYSKAMLFSCTDIAEQVLQTSDPKTQKALGRKVRNFDAAIWDAKRLNIVTVGCREKFAQNPRLRDLLIATGTRHLVEASPYDRVWGIGLRETDAKAENPAQWIGQNLLGEALMAARSILISEVVARAQTSLTPYNSGLGSTAWRAAERDAPGLFAMITAGADAPRTPETDTMTFAIYEEGADTPLGAHVIGGRPGLNQFYLKNIGHEPDKEADGAMPIFQFIDDVASHLLLRYFVGEPIEEPGSSSA
jgi:ribA/ribD-fused uncharacterized protein